MIRKLLASARRLALTAGLAVAVTVPTLVAAPPAVSAPLSALSGARAPVAETDVQQVGHRRWHRGRYYRHGRHWRHRHHRGDRNAALALGLGIGVLGALAAQPRYYYDDPYYSHRYVAPRRVYRSYGGAHVDWCYARYRSYRAYDNTFQPYHGPRRTCYSPYG